MRKKDSPAGLSGKGSCNVLLKDRKAGGPFLMTRERGRGVRKELPFVTRKARNK